MFKKKKMDNFWDENIILKISHFIKFIYNNN